MKIYYVFISIVTCTSCTLESLVSIETELTTEVSNEKKKNKQNRRECFFLLLFILNSLYSERETVGDKYYSFFFTVYWVCTVRAHTLQGESIRHHNWSSFFLCIFHHRYYMVFSLSQCGCYFVHIVQWLASRAMTFVNVDSNAQDCNIFVISHNKIVESNNLQINNQSFVEDS